MHASWRISVDFVFTTAEQAVWHGWRTERSNSRPAWAVTGWIRCWAFTRGQM